MASTPSTTKAHRANPLLKPYLIAYNALSLLAWAYILTTTLQFILTGPHVLPPVSSHGATGPLSATGKAQELLAGFGERLFGLSKGITHLPSPSSIGSTTASTIANDHHQQHHAKSLLAAFLPSRLSAYLSGSYAYKALGPIVVWTQTAALLEVVHAATGAVRSSPVTVGMQVASRVWMVWGVVEQRPETHANPLFTSMILAWSITECTRYAFYLLALLHLEPRALLWARYNLFYILYPLGAGSEAFLMRSVLPSIKTLPAALRHHKASGMAAAWDRLRSLGGVRGREWGAYELFVGFLFVIWWPVFGKGKTLGAKKRQ
ncbi:hypothetical protein QFC19_001474 [Naganishia cerealis]|uniref:Uncharacterized protein n=1 Tax=Naganishia cerealis TaxID=610337 RepID=A0ACC2WH34_9TREE|nr:hypothetical protein QFC19_001474 [Naganishia cerealis]